MTSTESSKWSSISKIVFLAFCLIVATLLIYEHRIHVLGFLPVAFLLACPLMHLFMHHGHGHHHGQGPGDQGRDTEIKGGPDHA